MRPARCAWRGGQQPAAVPPPHAAHTGSRRPSRPVAVHYPGRISVAMPGSGSGPARGTANSGRAAPAQAPSGWNNCRCGCMAARAPFFGWPICPAGRRSPAPGRPTSVPVAPGDAAGRLGGRPLAAVGAPHQPPGPPTPGADSKSPGRPACAGVAGPAASTSVAREQDRTGADARRSCGASCPRFRSAARQARQGPPFRRQGPPCRSQDPKKGCCDSIFLQ